MRKLTQEEIERLTSIPFNPLADYQAQIAPNNKRLGKRLRDTSLRNDADVILIKDDPNKVLYYHEDLGNFRHSKLMSTAEIRDKVMSWASSTHKLFLWILFTLEYRREIVTLELEKMKKLGFEMSRGTFEKAIKELIDSKIIMRVESLTDRETGYWEFIINPQIIWKGDAKQYYKDLLSVHPEYLNGNQPKDDTNKTGPASGAKHP